MFCRAGAFSDIAWLRRFSNFEFEFLARVKVMLAQQGTCWFYQDVFWRECHWIRIWFEFELVRLHPNRDRLAMCVVISTP